MQVTGDRLREARRLRKLTQTELARRVGTSSSQISMMETNKSGTSLKTAMSVATALRVSLDYLAGWVDDPRPARVLLGRLNAKMEDLQDIDEDYASQSKLEATVEIGITQIESAAGAGATVHDEHVLTKVNFPARWLFERGLRPSSCRFIRVRGESMEPTLPDGSLILVDLATEHPKSNKIFVIRTGDELIVKRLVKDTKVGWLLESDHPQRSLWPTQLWPNDADIVGEVRWVGRNLP